MTLHVADSWLVEDGRVRAVDRHWARFSAACGEHGVTPEALTAFRADVERAVPTHGRWFPRVELREGLSRTLEWYGSHPEVRPVAA